MVVRVQVRPVVIRLRLWIAYRKLAMTTSHWLTGIAVIASACAFWRLGYDLHWIGEFAVSQGLFSHWQVWLAIGVLVQILASMLQRYGRDDGPAIP